jgi:short-subunit dehydrogenase
MSEGSALIVGATSGMARWAAVELARQGYKVILAGRDLDELNRIACDIKVRTGSEALVEEFHGEQMDSIPFFWRKVWTEHSDLRGILIAYGDMISQESINREPDLARMQMILNYNSPVHLLLNAAKDFEEQRHGWIACITSVAGDRGRVGNYLYGSAKGGLSHFLEGLRARLTASNVTVLTIKPGFVDSPMTWGMKLPPLPVADPRDVGKAIVKAIDSHKDVVYIPGLWRMVMFLIRHIPEKIFKRMKF